MKNVILNVNGEILRYPENLVPRISVFDRAYLYGDSLYEVCRTYDRRLFGTREHLDRLWKSAELMRMSLPFTRQELAHQMGRTLDAYYEGKPSPKRDPDHEAYVRLIVSRGAGKIGFSHKAIQTPPLITLIVQRLEPPTAQQLKQGMHLEVVDRLRNDRRAMDPAAKTGNYLNSILAFLEAEAHGAQDALFLNADGHLTEGTTFNLFYIRRGILVTPPTEIGILHGITRTRVLELAQELGMPTREIRFPIERLEEADEVFLTSTIKEVFPITKITNSRGSIKYPVGRITLRLRKEFQLWAKSQVASPNSAV